MNGFVKVLRTSFKPQMLKFYFIFNHIVSIFSLISSLSSSYSRVSLDKGSKTITKYETPTLNINKNIMYNKLCDIKSWNMWLSLTSMFKSDSNGYIISQKGQSFTEVFGLFGSSKIVWTVSDLRLGQGLSLYTSSYQGTFGWDSLELDFQLKTEENSNTNRDGACSLLFTYSWTVTNPLVLLVDDALVRPGMMSDNEEALKRLIALCY